MKQITTWVIFLIMTVMSSIGTEVRAVPQLPESDLTWKNVTVGEKKTTVFCMYRDSRGIMWTGTGSGLYVYDGVTVHPVGQNELSGTQIYSIIEHKGQLYLGGNNGLLIYDY